MKWNQAWLRYQNKENYSDKKYLSQVFVCIENRDIIQTSPIITNILDEIKLAYKMMFDLTPEIHFNVDEIEFEDKPHTILHIKAEENILGKEGYKLETKGNVLSLEAATAKGLLYGIFHLLRIISIGDSLGDLNIVQIPDNPLRMMNHWDNMDGSIERGYSGHSFFLKDDEVLVNERTKDYARLVASVGINGVVINNVNVRNTATELITTKYFDKLRQMAILFEGYGIQLFLSLNFAAPIEVGGLSSADPLEKEVIDWWSAKMAEVYSEVPNLGGFLVKADSEGRPGPFTYGRNHADGANMLAKIVEPYNGLIIWRCFVYNCMQDWRDIKTDRARAGYDNFMPLDGKFLDNVILQIKNGPMDFQIREPISPLLGGLSKTNQILEVQIAQEYTGQQKDLCYLIPMFKEILEFKTYCKEDNDTVADIVSGRSFSQTNCGMATVSNTGDDFNWTGNDLAAANFYGFGRLSFQTSLTAEEIAKEWIAMTISSDEVVMEAIKNMLLTSRKTYENYTSPLGIGWMVNPNHHYGPNVDGYEYDRWGTYHRADCKGLGINRGENGTGYAGQYHEPNASNYNSIEECPEELLLFFHYIEYTYELKSGKTLIQHIYDTHFEGAKQVEDYRETWISLREKIDLDVYERVLDRFDLQLKNAYEWRDIVNSYFYRKSGISDEIGRIIY
ncbi:MAG: alpha-glucuronidase [Clostridiales bacterium]|nr:alpha-glucuronidase [Clostridiales bacterium]